MTKFTKKKEWLKFEEEVALYLSALDKNATVLHNVDIPDKDTGALRQRDVWIKAKVSGFNIVIYVSCKNYNRKINQQDMDAVKGELDSSGANKGVIFSRLGFTKNAILKAKKHNVDCCSLVDGLNYQNIITKSFIIKQFAQKIHINYHFNGVSNKKQAKDFLNLKQENDGKIILDIVSESFKEIENESLSNNSIPISRILSFPLLKSKNKVIITIELDWEYYYSNLTAYTINGVYNFGETKFNGEIIFPYVDRDNPNLGPNWISCKKPVAINNYIMISLKPTVEQYKELILKIIENSSY